MTPGYDYLEDKGGYSNYLGAVRQYANNEEVRKMSLDFSDELEGIRLLSAMYRNNSCIIKNLKDIAKPTPNNNGYDPLYGKITTKKNEHQPKNTKDLDAKKMSYLERLVQETIRDSVQMIFFISPYYETIVSMDEFQPVIELSKTYNIPLYNNISKEGFEGHEEFFQDYSHLNSKGAVAYSRYVIGQLKQKD